MTINETVPNICNTEIESGLWSKGERRMKYKKPEMEVLGFEQDVKALDIVGSSNEPNNNDVGGEW